MAQIRISVIPYELTTNTVMSICCYMNMFDEFYRAFNDYRRIITSIYPFDMFTQSTYHYFLILQ